MYIPHPSETLNQLFSSKPFQGASPAFATFLFLGLDANYSDSIEGEPIFSKIVEYHEDGCEFWRKYGVHHPFLLPGYSGSGRYYHRSFAEIGLTPERSDAVSFVELLHLPTTGQSKLELSDLDTGHLQNLAAWIIEGSARHIFFPAGVVRLLRRSGLFDWIPSEPLGKRGDLKVLLDQPEKHVYQHLHFSNYGKFLEQKRREAREIFHIVSSNV